MTNTINEWADFWRDTIGVNVFPADTINKTTDVEWFPFQDNPIPHWKHEKWKREDAFSKGIAIIVGKVWFKEDKKGLYLTFIDIDKLKGMEELCTRNGKTITLQEISKKWIVEQHRDNLDKAHIYFYSPIPFPKKAADSILGLEIKGLGEHGIAFCTPSIHKDGHPYEIIGTNQPEVLTELQAHELIQHIDQICIKYGLQYLEKEINNNRLNAKLRNIIKTLQFDKTCEKIPQGQRHNTLISVANSLLFKHLGKGKSISEEWLKHFFGKLNFLLCTPNP